MYPPSPLIPSNQTNTATNQHRKTPIMDHPRKTLIKELVKTLFYTAMGLVVWRYFKESALRETLGQTCECNVRDSAYPWKKTSFPWSIVIDVKCPDGEWVERNFQRNVTTGIQACYFSTSSGATFLGDAEFVHKQAAHLILAILIGFSGLVHIVFILIEYRRRHQHTCSVVDTFKPLVDETDKALMNIV